MLTLKGVRESVYYVAMNRNEHSDNWQRIVNFLDGGIAKEMNNTELEIEKCENDLQQAKELVNEPFALEEELKQAQSRFDELEKELAGLSEQNEEVFDPEDMGGVESEEERAERKAFEKRDENDLEPDDPPMTQSPHRSI